MASPTPAVECFRLGPLVSSRIWTGLWQLSSQEWGTAKVSKVIEAMKRHVEMGYTGFGTHTHHRTHQRADDQRRHGTCDLDLSASSLLSNRFQGKLLHSIYTS
jgi:hypothetical protein